MTDVPQLTPEEELTIGAKIEAEKPPEPVPGSEQLPTDVYNGWVEDEPTIPKEA